MIHQWIGFCHHQEPATPLLATEPDTGDVVGLVAPSHMAAWPGMGSMAISMGKSSENHGEHPVWSWRFEGKLPELEVIFGKIIEVLVFFQPWSWLPEGMVLSFVLVPCYVWLMRTSLADLTLEKDPKTATHFGYVFCLNSLQSSNEVNFVWTKSSFPHLGEW